MATDDPRMRSTEQPDAAFEARFTKCKWLEPNAHNLTIGKDPKFIWYRNAKVGTRTCLATLDQAGISYQVRQAFRCNYAPETPEAYFKFAFVRNPWDRLVSFWLNKLKPGKKQFLFDPGIDHQNFGDVVRYLNNFDLATCDAHFRLQTRLVPLAKLDFIGRFETYEADLRTILGRLGIETSAPIERRNSTKDRLPYQSYYTPELVDIVAELYKDDIDALGYKF